MKNLHWKKILFGFSKITALIVLILWLIVLVIPHIVPPRYAGPPSDHFDGKVFFNREKGPRKNFLKVLQWQLFGNKKHWPDYVPNPELNVRPIYFPPGQGKVKVTFVNHATVLLETDKGRILTDPVLSERVSPFDWIGPKRVRDPGLTFENLPTIHFVLISHNHYDHLDLATLEWLVERDNPLIVVPLGDCTIVESIHDVRCHAMDWWDHWEEDGLELIFTPAKHWSSRWGWDRNRSLWGAYVIRVGGKQIYFAGDTGYGRHFRDTQQEFEKFDLALLPIGAYEPRWFMRTHHVNPAESVKAHQELRARKSVGIHFGTFRLTDEGIEDPILDLGRARSEADIDDEDFFILEHGEFFYLD